MKPTEEDARLIRSVLKKTGSKEAYLLGLTSGMQIALQQQLKAKGWAKENIEAYIDVEFTPYIGMIWKKWNDALFNGEAIPYIASENPDYGSGNIEE